MRIRFMLALALALTGAPAGLAAQARMDSMAAVTPRPVAATRPHAPRDSTSRREWLCDRLDVMDHYTGRVATWGTIIGVTAGLGWAIVESSKDDAALAAPANFLIGPAMGGAYGLGAGIVAGLGKWGWDGAHGRTWRPGRRARARRDGFLCAGVGVANTPAQHTPWTLTTRTTTQTPTLTHR